MPVKKSCLDCGVAMLCHHNRKRCEPCAVIVNKTQVRSAGRRWDLSHREERSEQHRLRYLANPERSSQQHAVWAEKNKEHLRQYTQAYWRKNKDRMQAQYREWLAENRGVRLGLKPGEYKTMHLEQKGLCAICRNPESSKRRQLLAVDHDHSTGVVRELLCTKCNSALGMVNDSPEILEAMSSYLIKHRDRKEKAEHAS